MDVNENWPDFNADGNLPSGVYLATLAQVVDQFGQGSPARQDHAQNLARIYRLALSTDQLQRFVIYGSFVSSRSDPADLDLFLTMGESFQPDTVSRKAAQLFQHELPAPDLLQILDGLKSGQMNLQQVGSDASQFFERKSKPRYPGASIFWMRQLGEEANELINAAWQITKTPGIQRGIVELIASPS
jgi:hypothetical protein